MGVKRANTLKLLPSRLASRIYGQVNSLPMPYHLRHLAYSSWAWAFKAKLEEVPLPLTAYPSLLSFFTRKLKPGVRPVDDRAAIVSPADSAVVSTSSDLMNTGILRQVKGFDFKVEDFLGLAKPPQLTNPKDNVLHSIVLYLSPGDYHRFHSPTEWSVESRTHIAGQLLPVNPIVAHLLPSLLCTNERVVLSGKWQNGLYFSYTAVGATNVGSIRLTHEPELKTNVWQDDWRTGFSVNDALGLKPATLRVPQAVDPRIGLKKLAQLSATSSQAVAAHLPRAIPMAVTSLGKTIYSSLQAFNPLAFLAPQRKLQKQITAAAAATAAAKRNRSESNASGTSADGGEGGEGIAVEEIGRAAAEAALLNPARARAQSRYSSMASMSSMSGMMTAKSVINNSGTATRAGSMMPLKRVKEEANAAADDDDDEAISPPLKVKAPTASAGLTGVLGGLLGGGRRAQRSDSLRDQDDDTSSAPSSSSSAPCPPIKTLATASKSKRGLKKVTTAQAFAAATAPSAGAVSRVSGETVVANSSAPSGAYLPSAPILKARHYDRPVQLLAGDEVGWFELGSTVVLIFEAPKDFKFNEELVAGKKVVLGRPLTPVERSWDGPRGTVHGLTPEQAHDFLNASAKDEKDASSASPPVVSGTSGGSGAGAMPVPPTSTASTGTSTGGTSSSMLSAALMGVMPTSWLKAAGLADSTTTTTTTAASGAASSGAAGAEVEGMGMMMMAPALDTHHEGEEDEGEDEDGDDEEEEEDEHEYEEDEDGVEDGQEGEEEEDEDETVPAGGSQEEGEGVARGAAAVDDNDDSAASAAAIELLEKEGAEVGDFLSAVSFDDEDALAMEAVINERWGEGSGASAEHHGE